MKIETPDQAKAAAERLAGIKSLSAEETALTKELKEYIEAFGPVQVYHDGKCMVLDFHRGAERYPAGDLRNSWELKKGANQKLYALVIKYHPSGSAAAAFGVFKAVKKEVENAVKHINNPEFNAALAELVDFSGRDRFGFKVIEKEDEHETGNK